MLSLLLWTIQIVPSTLTQIIGFREQSWQWGEDAADSVKVRKLRWALPVWRSNASSRVTSFITCVYWHSKSGQLSLKNGQSKKGWWKLGRGRSKVLGVWSSFRKKTEMGDEKKKKKKEGLSVLTQSGNKVKGEIPGLRQWPRRPKQK